MRQLVATPGILLAELAISGCEPKTRDNVFVPNVFGGDSGDRSRVTVPPYETPPAVAPDSRTEGTAIDEARRGTIRRSPVIRQPGEPVYPIAERALASMGVTVRRDGDLVVVEPDPRGPSGGGLLTALVVRRLEHVDRAQIEQALQPFLAPDARVSAGPLPDTLLLSGSEDGVGALANLVDALDIDPLANRSFGLFPLSSASAGQVAEELRVILDTGQPPGPQIIEIERMNAVLVITENRRAMEEARSWARKLDQSDAQQAEIQIYQVQNRRAADLAELLQQALATGETRPSAVQLPAVRHRG